jgi:hypothetical protein
VDAYFISHHEREKRTSARIRLKGKGIPIMLDPWDGEVYNPPRWERHGESIDMDYAFEPNDAFFVLLGEEGDLPSAEATRLDPRWLSEDRILEVEWKLSLDQGDTQPMRLRDMPAHPRFEELMDEHVLQTLEPWEAIGLMGFSGGGTYEANFRWADGAKSALFLDLGDVGVVAEVFLNDVDCGVRMWKPYRYPISAAIREGENRLRIRVANTLANAIQETYFKQEVPTAATQEQVQRFARFKEGELRSGLLGPVMILKAAE